MNARTVAPNLDRVFDALANEHRREIILSLGLQPASISQLASLRVLSLPAIHKHVKVLEAAGLVSRQKTGRVNFLTLNRASLRGIQKWITQFHAYWDSGSETLENYAHTIELKNQHTKTAQSNKSSDTAKTQKTQKKERK